MGRQRDFRKLFTIGVSAMLGLAFICSGAVKAETMSSSSTDTRLMVLESVRQNYLASERQKGLEKGVQNLAVSASARRNSALWLRKVDSTAINMVTNRLLRGERRAVRVDGKDYFVPDADYGYNFRLNLSLRYAVDPLTGRRIDKSAALAYADTKGRVFYFESEQNYRDFICLLGK